MRSRAFTLIELLVVISIISLLSSVVLASLNTAREKGRIASGKQFAANIYHATADQAVAIWNFDEDTTTPAVDLSGYANNLTLANGATRSTDTISGTGKSLFLDGSNDYSFAADSSSLDIGTNDVTIVSWVKTSYTGISQRIVSKRFGGLGLGYSLVLGPTGVPYIEILNASTYITAAGPYAVNDDKWHFVAGVIDRDGSGFVCVDSICGTKVNFAPMSSDDISNSLSLEVGSTLSGSSGRFSGLIDEVRIYTKALTASEASELYVFQKGKFELAGI